MSRSEKGFATVFALLITAIAIALASVLGSSIIHFVDRTITHNSVSVYVVNTGNSVEVVNPTNVPVQLSKLKVYVNGEQVNLSDQNSNGYWEPGEQLKIKLPETGGVSVVEIYYDGQLVYKAAYIKPVSMPQDKSYPSVSYAETANGYSIKVSDDTSVAAIEVYAGTKSGEQLVASYSPYTISELRKCYEEYRKRHHWPHEERMVTFRIRERGHELESIDFHHGHRRAVNENVTYVRVVAFDVTGKPTSVVITRDSPPVVTIERPKDGEVFRTSSGSARVNVVARAWDDFGIKSVELFFDGRSVARCSTDVCTATVTAGAGVHTVRAVATDTADQKAAAEVTIRVVRDAPPKVEIVSPKNGSVFYATKTASVKIAARASDDRGIKEVDFYVDGKLAWKDTSAPYGFTARLGIGRHAIEAVAVDTANQKASDSISITVKRDEPPTVAIYAPNSVATHSEAAVTIRISAKDDRELKLVELFVNGRAAGRWSVNSASFTAAKTLTLSPGSYVVEAAAYDSAGQKAASRKAVVVEFRNAAPVISAPKTVTAFVGREVRFTVTARDPDGDRVTVKASLPAGAAFDGRTFTWYPAKAGTYYVTFTATDQFGASSSARTAIVVKPAGFVRIVSLQDPTTSWFRIVKSGEEVVVGEG